MLHIFDGFPALFKFVGFDVVEDFAHAHVVVGRHENREHYADLEHNIQNQAVAQFIRRWEQLDLFDRWELRAFKRATVHGWVVVLDVEVEELCSGSLSEEDDAVEDKDDEEIKRHVGVHEGGRALIIACCYGLSFLIHQPVDQESWVQVHR